MKWTAENSAAAEREGWILTNCDGYLELQRLDEAEHFKSDAEAIAHVYFAATQGSPLHLHALDVLLSPENRAAVIASCGPWAPLPLAERLLEVPGLAALTAELIEADREFDKAHAAYSAARANKEPWLIGSTGHSVLVAFHAARARRAGALANFSEY